MAPEPEVLDPEQDTVADDQRVRRLRHPGVPVTVNDLAALKGEAIEVIEARIQILETARKRGVRMTSPEDWVLFKAKDDRITGYLSDAGCDRLRDITGIEIFDVGQPERIVDADGKGGFMYLITGNGRSRLTMQVVETMEGGRHSSDDFCKDKTGAALELTVRKAARANLDGNITRELAGLKSVPLEELIAAWEGTSKKSEHCRKGRGFGSQDERVGAHRENEPQVEPPTCPHCAPVNGAPVKLKFRQAKGDRKAFFGCPNYDKHANQRVIIDAAEWVAKQQQAATRQPQQSSAAATAPSTPAAAPRPEPIPASSIFDRDPGQEG